MTSLSKASFWRPLLLAAGGAPQHSVDAGQDLLHLKGLDNIVVRTHFQAGDLVAGLPLAVSMMTGTLLLSRIFFSTDQPSITGSMMSSSTRSGWKARNCTPPLPPSLATRGSKPSFPGRGSEAPQCCCRPLRSELFAIISTAFSMFRGRDRALPKVYPVTGGACHGPASHRSPSIIRDFAPLG